jgi:hypothetical protein
MELQMKTYMSRDDRQKEVQHFMDNLAEAFIVSKLWYLLYIV